jgi:hypothetical protein
MNWFETRTLECSRNISLKRDFNVEVKLYGKCVREVRMSLWIAAGLTQVN